MGKLFKTNTSDTINVEMSIVADCFDDRYVAEVQSAEVKVWNEGTRLFCSVKATLEISDTEDPRNTAIVLVEESKVALPSLEKDITYKFDDEFVRIDSYTSIEHRQQVDMYDLIDRWLEIYVRIEGI